MANRARLHADHCKFSILLVLNKVNYNNKSILFMKLMKDNVLLFRNHLSDLKYP